MISTDLKRHPAESELAYINRIGLLKQSGVIDKTWRELADLFNSELRDEDERPWSESAYRKRFASMQKYKKEFDCEFDPSESAEDIKELRRELEKEKVKFRDERNEYNKLIREQARRESCCDQFVSAIEKAAGTHPLKYIPGNNKIGSGDTTLCVPLSDLHAGAFVNNYWNNYDEDILRQMLNYYIDNITHIAETHRCGDVVVLATELVNGVINPTNRILSNQDLIDSFLMVTDYVCDFLAVLSTKFTNVSFYVAPGNHGRIMPKKRESLANENIENLVIPYVRAKMVNYPNIHCYDNEINPGIVTLTVRGQRMAFVHGDLDTMDNVTNNMTKMLGYTPEIILMGHLHYNSFKSDNTTCIIQSGSMIGPDEYAVSHRLIGRPEQSPFVVSSSGVDCIYNVRF